MAILNFNHVPIYVCDKPLSQVKSIYGFVHHTKYWVCDNVSDRQMDFQMNEPLYLILRYTIVAFVIYLLTEFLPLFT